MCSIMITRTTRKITSIALDVQDALAVKAQPSRSSLLRVSSTLSNSQLKIIANML